MVLLVLGLALDLSWVGLQLLYLRSRNPQLTLWLPNGTVCMTKGPYHYNRYSKRPKPYVHRRRL